MVAYTDRITRGNNAAQAYAAPVAVGPYASTIIPGIPDWLVWLLVGLAILGLLYWLFNRNRSSSSIVQTERYSPQNDPYRGIVVNCPPCNCRDYGHGKCNCGGGHGQLASGYEPRALGSGNSPVAYDDRPLRDRVGRLRGDYRNLQGRVGELEKREDGTGFRKELDGFRREIGGKIDNLASRVKKVESDGTGYREQLASHGRRLDDHQGAIVNLNRGLATVADNQSATSTHLKKLDEELRRGAETRKRLMGG
jgi:hypothetical protein